MNKTSSKPNRIIKAKLQSAFSLVELLVVIAVIGVIAAIAIPNISDVTSSATIAKDQRNAQQLASVASSARAAGYAGPWASKKAAIADLTGGTITGANPGPFSATTFAVSGLSDAEKGEASAYLKQTGNLLEYVPAGGEAKVAFP